MAVFAISFRVLDEEATDYSARYNSLNTAIQDEAKGKPYWNETTSFYVLESTKSSEALRDSIIKNCKINSDDVLLVINLSQKAHKSRGNDKKALLDSIMLKR